MKWAFMNFDHTLGYPGEGPPNQALEQDSRGTLRPREPSPDLSSQGCGWSIAAPRGRYVAVCATCCSEIPPRMPRARRGDHRARVHHIGCVSLQCGQPRSMAGWADLDAHAQSVAIEQFDNSWAGRASPDDGDDGDDAADAVMLHSQDDVQMGVPAPGMEERLLQRMDFWEQIPWNALHDPVRATDCVPEAVKPALAELRGSIAKAATSTDGAQEQEKYLKAFFFLDRLIFAASRRQRGGSRGQKGETVSRTIARRIRAAWEGCWGALWEESNAAVRSGAGSSLSEPQKLARDVKLIEEALADDDVREALRCIDTKLGMADDRKARRCLPHLFPQALSQPIMEERDPADEDVTRFRRELCRAYQYAPRHRGSGPGAAKNEHWSWMPRHEDAWCHVEAILLRFALAKLPTSTMQALLSARALAADRDEPDKVRPLALGAIHRRLTSKAVSRTFQARVAATTAPIEHSVSRKCGAELMHKSVLVDLDSRSDAIKLSFDVSNAHNEFDRGYAIQCIREDVPDLLPWVRGPLCHEAVHEYVGMDGSRMQLRKTRGGDQGDAITSLVFPLTYKRVAKIGPGRRSCSRPTG